jgi:hypothetical protein
MRGTWLVGLVVVATLLLGVVWFVSPEGGRHAGEPEPTPAAAEPTPVPPPEASSRPDLRPVAEGATQPVVD